MSNITQLLLNWSQGEKAALEQLFPVVYNELRHQAANLLSRERREHTLQPTALVHEAYLKLVDQEKVEWQNRAQFFALSAQIMRNILVDHARKNLAEKRGGGAKKISLEDVVTQSRAGAAELVALDEALEELAKLDRRKSQIIELRYFGGLNIEEIESVIGVSAATIRRDMRFAEAWLYKQMSSEF
ncbi:MAG: sigma-70 family RNA polymerase sigma factor [Acidobacteriota bacterium]|nr:sigma-70 family RNA polymerase sigma factor [Acidobacteriota bacterium]